MKVAFSKAKKYVPEYNDNQKQVDEVQFYAVLKPLTNNDLFLIMDAIQETGLTGKVDTTQLDGTKTGPFVKLVPDLLPRYIEIVNLKDEDGETISIETVATHAFFLPLQIELLLQLSAAGSPTDEDTKK